MTSQSAPVLTLDPAKFRDPDRTATGEVRARVHLTELRSLWINTGTLCNIACANCYIESTPRNNRLAYITIDEVEPFLDEIAAAGPPDREVGLTGGEPFMNPDIIAILTAALGRGLRVLVLTNAMRPMMRYADALVALKDRYGPRLAIRVSLDHHGAALHEKERGAGTWPVAVSGLRWLSANGFTVHVAGRTLWGEPEESLRQGYARMFAESGIAIDAGDPVTLMLLPEMDESLDIAEITDSCWNILDVAPESMMCATSRMVVKRKGAEAPVVVPCTLIPYDAAFDMGGSLAEAAGVVKLNHPHCARFCVLGGGSCGAPG